MCLSVQSLCHHLLCQCQCLSVQEYEYEYENDKKDENEGTGIGRVRMEKSKTHKTGFSVRLEFSIKQNDVLPLKLLYSKLNMGNLSVPRTPRTEYGEYSPYSVRGVRGTERFPIFNLEYKSFKGKTSFCLIENSNLTLNPVL